MIGRNGSDKRVLLLDPADSAHLYSDHGPGAHGTTPIDPARVDLALYPLVRDVSLWSATLRAGDLLLIPADWWHLVASLPSAASARNLAVTVQFDGCSGDGGSSHGAHSAARAEEYLRRRAAPSPASALASHVSGKGGTDEQEELAALRTVADLSRRAALRQS